MAGRPRNADRFEPQVLSFTGLAADHLGQCYENLIMLADGKAVRVESKWVAAGTLIRKDVARHKDGSVVLDAKGKTIAVEVRTFPDLPADQLVLIEERRIGLPPDVKANEILVDRPCGKPRQAVELENGEGGPLKIEVVYELAPACPAEAPSGPAAGAPGDEAV